MPFFRFAFNRNMSFMFDDQAIQKLSAQHINLCFWVLSEFLGDLGTFGRR